MNPSFPDKRSYHPLLIVLFHLQLPDQATLHQIPFSTRAYWRNISQEDQFGYEAVRAYLEAQLDRRVLKRKIFVIVAKIFPFTGYEYLKG